MDYILLDLEWNQTYMQKALAVQRRIGAHLHGEVIQIGAVKLNEELQITGSYSIIVKPKFFCKIHRHVRDLTGITQEMIDRGTPLPTAIESFRRFCGDSFVLLTWGPDDVPMLCENLQAHRIPSEWLDCDYDLQRIYRVQREPGGNQQRSLEYAMEQFGLTQNLPAHDALNDAYFTAKVAQKLDLVGGVRDYGPRAEKLLIDATYGDSDIGGIGYETAEEALQSEEAAVPPCPLCGTALSVLGRNLHGRGHRYQTLCECEKDGAFLLTLRLTQNFDGSFRFRKTATVADPAECEQYRAKMQERKTVRRRRRRRHKPAGEANPATTG